MLLLELLLLLLLLLILLLLVLLVLLLVVLLLLVLLLLLLVFVLLELLLTLLLLILVPPPPFELPLSPDKPPPFGELVEDSVATFFHGWKPLPTAASASGGGVLLASLLHWAANIANGVPPKRG